MDPSRPQQLHHIRSVLVKQPRRTPFPAVLHLPPLLRMPAEVLDLISDFIMELDTSSPRPFDPLLEQKVQSLQNLRYTCRQLVSPCLSSSLTNFSITILSLAFISCLFFMLDVNDTAHKACSFLNKLLLQDLSILRSSNIRSISLSIRNRIRNLSYHTDELRLFRRSQP